MTPKIYYALALAYSRMKKTKESEAALGKFHELQAAQARTSKNGEYPARRRCRPRILRYIPEAKQSHAKSIDWTIWNSGHRWSPSEERPISGWPWGESDETTSGGGDSPVLEQGINLIDTAPVYGIGRSEELIGKAIAGSETRSF